jgi:hypothetical protein
VPSDLSREQLNQLEKLGASVRMEEINRERDALNTILNGATRASVSQFSSPERVTRRRRPTWTVAQRKAVSVRMKKYWAARRAGRKE